MTLASSKARDRYQGNGAAKEFPVTFTFIEHEELKVLHTAQDGTESLLQLDEDFSVVGGNGETGAVFYPKGGGALLATGEYLTIIRNMRLTQGLDLVNQGSFDADLVEQEFDRSRMIDQQLQEQLDRAVKVAPGGGISPEDLVSEIRAARDSANADRGAAEAARSGVEGALNAVRSVKNTIESTRDNALAALQSVTGAGVDVDSLFRDQLNRLISGKLAGTGGEWECTHIGEITPDTVEFNTTYDVGNTTGIKNLAIARNGSGGWLPQQYLTNLNRLESDFCGVIYGNSKCYKIYCAAVLAGSAVCWRIQVHPQCGDVRADFTAGTAYRFVLFRRSGDVAKQHTGEYTQPEYFVGNNVTEMPFAVGDSALLNPVRLGEMTLYGTGVSRRLGNMILSDKFARIDRVVVYSKNRSTSYTLTAGDATLPGEFFVSSPENRASPNISQLSAWGYSSEQDFLDNGCIRVYAVYFMPRLKPYAIPAARFVVPPEKLHMLQTSRIEYGANLITELLGKVPTKYSSYNNAGPFTRSTFENGRAVATWLYLDSEVRPRYNGEFATVAMTAGAYVHDGTLQLCIIFKELLYDTEANSWNADSGALEFADYSKTTTDDNGNVILCGCMGFDTGIAIPEA